MLTLQSGRAWRHALDSKTRKRPHGPGRPAKRERQPPTWPALSQRGRKTLARARKRGREAREHGHRTRKTMTHARRPLAGPYRRLTAKDEQSAAPIERALEVKFEGRFSGRYLQKFQIYKKEAGKVACGVWSVGSSPGSQGQIFEYPGTVKRGHFQNGNNQYAPSTWPAPCRALLIHAGL